MTREEAVLKISEKLQKQMHLINSEKQRNNPKMLCDNLALRVMTAIEEMGMLPPPTYIKNAPKVEGNRVDLVWDKE